MSEADPIRHALCRLGYLPFSKPTSSPPRRMIRAFQREHGLRADGIIGPRTKAALALALEESVTSAAPEKIQAAVPPMSMDAAVSFLDIARRISPGFFISPAENHVHLLAVRGWKDGEAVPNRLDEYNDTIHVVSWDGSPARVYPFPASVDPGRLREPDPRGTAHLVAGNYRYRLGLHRGRERALVQAGPVEVMRYSDITPDAVPIREEGWFGINMHRGGTGAAVGPWSAGCQVIHGSLWHAFLHLLLAAHCAGQRIYPYTLVEGDMLAREVAEAQLEAQSMSAGDVSIVSA